MSDLLVVGGGPVGLAVAVDAAQRGMDVVVAEARNGDGDKACGEGLMPSAVAALARLGVNPTGAGFRGISYVRGQRRVTSTFPDGTGRGVRRPVLIEALRERAREVGVRTVRQRVSHLEQSPDSVRAGSLQARYVAVADGLHSPLRRSLGLERPSNQAARYGLRQHMRLEPWTDTVEVHWADDCEAYVTPVGEKEIGVAVLCPGGAPYSHWLTRFPGLLARVDGAAPTSSVRGAGPLRQTASARVAGRALLVGDAAGYVDALTGEGMAVGFAAAAELVRCVAADSPAEYEAAWRRVTRTPRLLTDALLRATRISLARRALVPAAQRLPWAFDAAVRALA